jgi:hypothetical protein
VGQVQADHAVQCVQHHDPELVHQAGTGPLIAAPAHRGRRAAGVADALVAGAEDQNGQEPVEDEAVIDAGAVTPQRVGVFWQGQGDVDQGEELLAQGVEDA